jgi:hypothetical protein
MCTGSPQPPAKSTPKNCPTPSPPPDPFPKRLFGTHWCGKGGAGPPINDLDAACMSHVVSMGKEIIDPQTQQSLGRMESPCCDVVIDKVATTLSYGHLENTKMPLDSMQPDGLQIREELTASQSGTPTAASVKPASGTTLAAAKDAPAEIAPTPAENANKKW